MIEVVKDFKDHPVQMPPQQGHLTLNHIAQGLTQTVLEHCQGWGIHSLPEQPVPLSQHIHSKEFISNLYFPFFTLYPLLLVLSLVFHKESLTRFPVGPLQIVAGCYEVSSIPTSFFSRQNSP